MKRTVIKASSIILLAILYGAFAVWRCSYVGINSDFANLVLEASDILSGNIMRSGWNLTGISFLTTDIPYFLLGTLFFGTSTKAYYFTCGAMYTALALVSVLLVRDAAGRRPFFSVLTFLAFALIPGLVEIDLARAHTGVFVIGFVCVWLWTNMSRIDMPGIGMSGINMPGDFAGNRRGADKATDIPANKVRLMRIIYIILLSLAVMGDPIILVMVIVPICLLSLVMWIRQERKTTELLKDIAINAGGVILGTVLDRLYFAVGGCNKNAFLDDKVFASLSEIHDKFVIYVRAILQMANAGFELNPVTNIQTLFYAVNTLAVIVFFVIVTINIIFMCMGRHCDTVTVVLGMGFFIMSALFVLTNISVNESSARYICYFPIFMAIVFIRNADMFFEKNNRLYGLVLLLFTVALIGRIRGICYDVRSLPYPQMELAEVLADNGLECGYSTFWSSSSVTVLSGGQVRVRAVLGNDGELTPDIWYCKDEWYREYADFVVTIPNDVSGVTEENMVAILGKPADTIDCGQYRILVYDEDISGYMHFDND